MAAGDWAKAHPQAAALYTCFVAGCLVVYGTLTTKPTGKYDYVLTLSAAFQTLAFGLLDLDTRSNVGEGLSEKTLMTFVMAHGLRLSTTFWGEGYIPEDSTADVYLYQSLELVGILFVAHKLYNLNTMRSRNNIALGMESTSMVGGMLIIAVILAYHTKSTGHGHYWLDLAWMVSVWLEAFALFPQVFLLLSAKAPYVDHTAIHFAVMTLIASCLFAGFWGSIAKTEYEEFEKNGEHGFFIAIVLASVIRVALCSVYVFVFWRVSQGHKGALVSSGKGEYQLCAANDGPDVPDGPDDFDEL